MTKYSNIELDKAIYVPPRGLSALLSISDPGHGGVVKSITREGDTVTIELPGGQVFDIPWSKCVKATQAEPKKEGMSLTPRQPDVRSNSGGTAAHRYESVPVAACLLLERNPQHLTPKQMESLKRSIQRDGFVVPILVRPLDGKRKGKFEIVSGNHRYMAAKEIGYETVPAVIADLPTQDAKRLALNLNLIHGDPTAEQLAPFLADLDDEVLSEIHIEQGLLDEVLAFDDTLASRLAELDDVPGLDQERCMPVVRRQG